jgi:branched-subunit amino acid aminotransferase/4-amino-4-deoxychorismate lyase
MSEPMVWIDGAFRRLGALNISVQDRAFLLGHAAFETMRCINGRLRRWDAHLERLQGGLAYLGVESPSGLNAIPKAAAELAAGQKIPDGVARLTVSAGVAGGGLQVQPGLAARIVLALKPRPQPPVSVSVWVADGARRSGSPGERFKLSGYADLIAARREAQQKGADRAVVTGPQGVLACADCANLYWIDDGLIFTPALEAGALSGVTRAALFKAADEVGVAIKEMRAEARALERAQAAFMTNSVEGVVAISSVNGLEKRVDHPLIEQLRRLEQALA